MNVKKRLLQIIILLIITNLITLISARYFFSSLEFNNTAQSYEKLLSQYAVYLENKNPEIVQKMITTPIYFDISKLGKNEKNVNEYAHLCTAWGSGLEFIISNGLPNKSDMNKTKGMNKTYQDYLIGAEEINRFCQEK